MQTLKHNAPPEENGGGFERAGYSTDLNKEPRCAFQI
jgi:hypothetical protein